jgi:peptidyl-prolyl cis-trans isomerase B (cyclophilin B)
MFTTFIVSLAVLTQPITPLRTYNGLKNGIIVEVELGNNEVGKVALFDYENNPLSSPAIIMSGTHNLVSRIPEIKQLTKAAWIQISVQNEPVGEPLVVQPMLSREVPIVKEELRPDGETTYTKIVGWQNEAEEDGVEGAFLSGWRVYVDKDALIETSKGDIRIALRPDVAPNTVWNFRELALGGLYQNTTFHRIVPMTSKGHPFVIQGGDPTGTGMGGAGAWLPIEHSTLPHDFGVVSMARAGDPDSAGCQIFICLSKTGTARLDNQYCSFGETIDGDDVIKAIASVQLADPAAGKPVDPPVIKSVSLIPKTK